MATTKIEYYAGATLIGTKTAAPWAFDWDTTGVTTGDYAITRKRYEDDVLVATSAAINVTVDAPAGAFEPSTISLQTLWHKGDLDTTDAVNVGDAVTSSTDSLTTTPYNFTSSNSIIQSKGSGNALMFISNRYIKGAIPASIFQSTFSLFMQLWVRDGRYTATQTLMHVKVDLNNSIFIYISTDGKLNVNVTAKGVTKLASTSVAAYADGDTLAFENIDIVVNLSGNVEIYKNETALTLVNADISGLDMTSFTGTTDLVFGSATSLSNGLDGWGKNIILQPVVHNNQNRTDLATL